MKCYFRWSCYVDVFENAQLIEGDFDDLDLHALVYSLEYCQLNIS